MKTLLLLALASMALTACGSDETATPTSPTSTATPPATTPDEASGTTLTITVDPGSGGEGVEYTLVCDPPGGEHPDPDTACAALTEASTNETSPLDPVPSRQACTEIYGGEQTAVIEGTLGGEPLRAELSRVNGCEIARWDALVPVLVQSGGVEGV
jgi:hypothetical protein